MTFHLPHKLEAQAREDRWKILSRWRVGLVESKRGER
jgi:hypothetical protein